MIENSIFTFEVL